MLAGVAWKLANLTVFATLLAGINSVSANTLSSVYGYDPDGRLTTGLYETTRCVVYSYDANGNRLSQLSTTKTVSPPAWGAASWNAFTWTAGAEMPIWGSGTWGCFLWTPP
jgi:YD repeat-containing protein